MTDERIRDLELKVAALTEGLLFTRGKALGLETAVLTLARHWGRDPQTLIEALHETMELLDAESGPGKPSGHEKAEYMRLIEQVSSVLHSRNR